MTQGAVMRSQRSAARKVRVRQRPCPARHVGLGPSLVDEHQPPRVKPALMLLPPGATTGDVGAVLLAGAKVFF